jgi:hypothetical protein
MTPSRATPFVVGETDRGPQTALDYADQLLREPDATTVGLWPRTAARLIRLAIERATEGHWKRKRPEVCGCPTTVRLYMLDGVLGRAGAREAYLLWSRLSDATHPHPYELAPTVGELRSWHDAAKVLVERLSAGVAP